MNKAEARIAVAVKSDYELKILTRMAKVMEIEVPLRGYQCQDRTKKKFFRLFRVTEKVRRANKEDALFLP
jgi:hypothetical protein